MALPPAFRPALWIRAHGPWQRFGLSGSDRRTAPSSPTICSDQKSNGLVRRLNNKDCKTHHHDQNLIYKVYLAEYTRLKREADIKVLPERLRNNKARLSRFQALGGGSSETQAD